MRFVEWVTTGIARCCAVVAIALHFSSTALASSNRDLTLDNVDEPTVTTIVQTLPPENAGDSWIFFLSSGRALRVADSERHHVEVLKSISGTNRFVELEFINEGKTDRIVKLNELTGLQSVDSGSGIAIEPLSAREYDALNRIDFKFKGYPLNPQGVFDFFKSFNLRVGSQCFHRAYYWAHQLWRQTGARTNKVFMFFSWKYIRHYNYHWWFHVAPYVHDEKGTEIVLDPTFLRKPVTMKEWTDNFLRNDPECPVVTNYVGHSAHGKNDWCYIVKAPMWSYHPDHIETANKKSAKIRTWHIDGLFYGRTTR